MQKIVRAYFDALPKSRFDEENCQRVINILSKCGCNVVQTALGVGWGYLADWGKEAASNIYTSKIADIKKADIVVFEMSQNSPLLSFESLEAINCSKPTLILYNQKIENRPDIAVLGHPSRNLEAQVYDENNLEGVIEGFVKTARKRIPQTRFTVRLSEELDGYLNFLKAKLKLSSKNDVVVKIIEERVESDDEFQNIEL